ncbi:CDP-glycerol glycerophosphotransferase family protein [Kitasatospora sp. NPDC096147]|uniref:CDP-glycerol glycerophosphotransferase family protein n=1 Tax=Kitasatospora sp. NPDC096147 TaxID=3364093 RepID=UPI003804AD11
MPALRADRVTAPRRPEPEAAHPAVPPEYGLRSARWTGGRLELTCSAHPVDRDTARHLAALTVLRLTRDGQEPVKLRTRQLSCPEVTEESGSSDFNHDWAAFTAELDPERLRDPDGGWPDAEWLVEVVLPVSLGLTGLRREHGSPGPHWCGSGEYPPAHWVDRDVRLLTHFTEHGLTVKLHRVWSRLTGLRAVDGGLELTGWAHDVPAGTVYRLRHRQGGGESRHPVVPDGQEFTVRLPFEAFDPGTEAADTEHWDGELLRPDGSTERPVLDDRAVPGGLLLAHPGGGSLTVKQLADGYPQFCLQPGAVLVDTVHTEGDGFRLAVRTVLPGDGPLELVLRHANGTGEVRTAQPRGGELTVPATVTGSDGTRLPLRRGIWELRLRPAGDPAAERPLQLTGPALAALPTEVRLGPADGFPAGGDKRVRLQSRWHDTLLLDSTPVLSAAERSPYAQHRLLTAAYPAARRRPLREAVLYDVFGGRGYADSPRAVHAELARRGLPLEHLWVVDDARATVPAGVRPVRSHSPEWYEALATSRYLVGNTHFPPFLERRPGQVVLQTWHGSLLKRIAHDVENPWLADAGYLTALDREVPQWSLLVSPSAFATPILRRAFRYDGELLESGYPRNDVLAAGADPAAVRRRLGIPDGKRVVLYAPTWREDQQRANGDGFHLGLRLDPDAARAALGEDHVLLVRPHAHVLEPLPGAGDGFLYDVGDYPDPQDLLLAADVLVTDYSSIMFDFAVTGRPMVFFTYDLEHYRDTLRGFYFDLEREAPGPLLPTSEQVVAELRALADGRGPTERQTQAYERFRAVHCGLDDGGAAARVADRMLELGAGG